MEHLREGLRIVAKAGEGCGMAVREGEWEGIVASDSAQFSLGVLLPRELKRWNHPSGESGVRTSLFLREK